MGLAKRVIPVLLYRDGMLVKGKQFDSSRVVGNAMQAAMIHQARGVDELLMIDVGATPAGRRPVFEFVHMLTEKCFMPITVGGGVRTVEDAQRLFDSGADKVLIGTAAITRPTLVSDCARHFGSQAVVVAVDALHSGQARYISRGCGAVVYATTPVAFARRMFDEGAGELVVTSVERDGMMCGYDLALIEQVSSAVSIPVIANGGCGNYQDMLDAIQCGASAVAAGAMFQFTDATPKGAARYLQDHGVEARV